MTVVTAVLFLLALTFATTNGWWYVSSYGVPVQQHDAADRRNQRQHNAFRAIPDVRSIHDLAALRLPDTR